MDSINIQLFGDTVIINDVVYRKEENSPRMWGRYETAEYLGFRTESKGKTIVNTINMYGKDKPWRILFPDFGEALDRGVLKPYPEPIMKEWLNKSRKERKELWKQNKPYGTY